MPRVVVHSTDSVDGQSVGAVESSQTKCVSVENLQDMHAELFEAWPILACAHLWYIYSEEGGWGYLHAVETMHLCVCVWMRACIPLAVKIVCVLWNIRTWSWVNTYRHSQTCTHCTMSCMHTHTHTCMCMHVIVHGEAVSQTVAGIWMSCPLVVGICACVHNVGEGEHCQLIFQTQSHAVEW